MVESVLRVLLRIVKLHSESGRLWKLDSRPGYFSNNKRASLSTSSPSEVTRLRDVATSPSSNPDTVYSSHAVLGNSNVQFFGNTS